MSHITHAFVSGKADGTDATLVKPTNWNADHVMTTDVDGVVLGRLAGAGAGPVQELPFGAVLPYGTVLPFAGATAPAGWLICDGSSLLRSSYPGLYNAILTAYGAVDGAHFNIPDLRGRVIAGLDGGTGRLPGFTTPGAAAGESAHVLSVNEMASHGHTITNQGSHAHGGIGGGSFVLANNGAVAWLPLTYNNGPTEQTYASGTTAAATIGGSTDGAGANWGHNNVQPTLSMNYIIKT